MGGTMKHFYAIELHYGMATNADGHLIGQVYVFSTAKARLLWVDDGNPYMTQKGHRRILAADSPTIRNAIRNESVIRILDEEESK